MRYSPFSACRNRWALACVYGSERWRPDHPSSCPEREGESVNGNKYFTFLSSDQKRAALKPQLTNPSFMSVLNYLKETLFAKRLWDWDISDAGGIFLSHLQLIIIHLLFKYTHNTALCKSHLGMNQQIKTTKSLDLSNKDLGISNLIWKFWTLTFL